jgi:hypothetical protein
MNQDSDSLFPAVEPFDGEVELSNLLDLLTHTILQYVVVDEEKAAAIALWIVHTYLLNCFSISPLLIINAPERACGKTVLLSLLAKFVHRPLLAANASPSALFRSIEKWQPTQLIDEADTFFRDNYDLLGMINAGHSVDGFVLRAEAAGSSFEPTRFSTYTAKALTGIALQKHLPASTMSRGIIIELRRKLPHERVDRLRYADPEALSQIASMLVRAKTDYEESIRNAHPHLPESLTDREQDNWEPLLKIAACASEEWIEKAYAAAASLSVVPTSHRVSGNDLLKSIHFVFSQRAVTRISSADLINAITSDPEQAWSTYNQGNPITPRQIANLLSPYGISSKTVRLGPHNTPKGYELSQFTDAFTRYLGAQLQGGDS